MVDFLGYSRLADHHMVVTLMILQVVMVLTVIHRDVTGFSLPEFGRTIFIDHTSAVVLRGGCTVDVMHRAKLGSVGCIAINNGTSILKGYYVWQI